jgi:hypothetical protein
VFTQLLSGVYERGIPVCPTQDEGLAHENRLPAPNPGKQLLQSLDEYLDAHATHEATAKTKAKYELPDIVWLCVLFVGLLLLGTLIPEGLFKDARYESYFEKLLTWGFAGGLLSRWISSPNELLLLTRRRLFQWASALLVAGCLLFVVDVVRVSATLQPFTTLSVAGTGGQPEGDPLPAAFWTRLRSHNFVLSDKEGTLRRQFSLSLWDILAARFHPTPDWRLLHRVSFFCPPGQCPSSITLQVQLRGGVFDSSVLSDLADNKIPVKEGSAVVIAFSGSREVSLPAGTYQVTVVAPDVCKHALSDLTLRKSGQLYAFQIQECQ